jgi:hypothetical protein
VTRSKTEGTDHNLDEKRIADVQRFCDEDPRVRRLLLVFDALRLRGVDRTQAARTAHLVVTAATPSDHGPIPGSE